MPLTLPTTPLQAAASSPLREDRLPPLLFALGCVICLGCSTIQVSTDYDPTASFRGFETYAWLPVPESGDDRRLHHPLVDARVRTAVDTELSDRGFQEVAKEDADFIVTYYLGLETRIDVRTVHTTFHYRRSDWHGGMRQGTQVTQYEVGTLLIDVLEPSETRLLWRGSAKAQIRGGSSRDRRERQIEDAVRRILDRFPPQPSRSGRDTAPPAHDEPPAARNSP